MATAARRDELGICGEFAPLNGIGRHWMAELGGKDGQSVDASPSQLLK